MRNLITIVFFAFFVWATAACTEQQQNDAEQAAEIQIERTRSAVAAGLERTEENLQDLGNRIEAASGEAREDLQATYDELAEQRERLQAEFNELQHQTGEAFAEAQEEMRQRMAGLERDLTEARLRAEETKDDFMRTARAELNELDARMEEVEGWMEATSAEARAKYQEALDDLRQERQAIATEYDRIEDATAEEFQDIRSDLAQAIAKFSNTLEHQAEEIKAELHEVGR